MIGFVAIAGMLSVMPKIGHLAITQIATSIGIFREMAIYKQFKVLMILIKSLNGEVSNVVKSDRCS
jgi:hypothetical protein